MSTTQQGGVAPPPPPVPPPKPFWSVKVTVALALNVPQSDSASGFAAKTGATVESNTEHEDAAWAFDQAVSQVRALAPVLQQGMAVEKASPGIEKGGGS